LDPAFRTPIGSERRAPFALDLAECGQGNGILFSRPKAVSKFYLADCCLDFAASGQFYKEGFAATPAALAVRA
jgi:hypothetical protein